jgi:hypothetical protein
MRIRTLLLALFSLGVPLGAAHAEDWRVQTVQGQARLFSAGAWSAAQPGALLPPGAIVETGDGGRALVLRDRDSIDVAAAAKIRIEGDDALTTTVRDFAGVVGVSESAAENKRFLVMTAHASALAQGAVFGVVTDPHGTTITVASGLVSVTDLSRRSTVDLGPGQTARIRLGQAAALLAPAEADAASAAAHDAAARLQPGGPPIATETPGDPRALGALKSDAKGANQAKAVDQATAELHELRGKAKLGKGDPKTVAAVGRMAEELMRDVDVETDPWNDDFKWTEVENGELRLKPIHRVVLGLSGSEALQFWTLALMISFILGMLTKSILKEAGFGMAMNTGLVMLAFIVAVLIRDAFFRAQEFIAAEPFLSLGMMIGAMPLLLLSGAFAKLRLDL